MVRSTRRRSGQTRVWLGSYLWLQLGGINNDDYLLAALQASGYHAEFHKFLPKKTPENKDAIIVLSKDESFRLLGSGVLHALINVYRLCALIPPQASKLLEKTVESEVMILFSINQPIKQLVQKLSVARMHPSYIDPLIQNEMLKVLQINADGTKAFENHKLPPNGEAESLNLDYRKASVRLTASECRVLDAILEGKSNRKIAEDDFLSVSTVNNHVSQLTNKLDANDRTHTVKRVIELGWLRGS